MWLGGGALLIMLRAARARRASPEGCSRCSRSPCSPPGSGSRSRGRLLPDRSWDYADRALVYLLFAALGLWLAARTRDARERPLHPARSGRRLVARRQGAAARPRLRTAGLARLSAPVGLWNQLALLGAFALPLALWRRRLAGTLLAYGWIVALLLTYSRGGILDGGRRRRRVVRADGRAHRERRDARRRRRAGGRRLGDRVRAARGDERRAVDARAVARRPHLRRAAPRRSGRAPSALERLPRPRVTPALRRGLLGAVLLVAVAAVVFVVVKGGGSGAVGNGGGRLGSTSSNFRFVWWRQAWREFTGHELLGTGAGTFHLANLRFRTSYLDFTIEPHNLPLQFLTEAGIVGLVLLLLERGVAPARQPPPPRARARAGARPARVPPALARRRRLGLRRRLRARVPRRRRARRRAAGAAGVAVPDARRGRCRAARVRRAAPALARRALVGPGGGRRSRPTHAITLAKRARSVDPLLVEPLLTLGFASDIAEQAARRAGLLRAGRARPAEEPGHAATRGAVRARPRLRAACLRVPRAVHGARSEGAPGGRADRLPAGAPPRQLGQADVLALGAV